MTMVFIMGPHRSGTTILYKVLSETGIFNVTTMFHVVNRERLAWLRDTGAVEEASRALAATLAARGLTDREFDSIKVSPDMPEEYAYALPRQGRRPRLDDANLPGFLEFCRNVQALQDPDRPLLLKNPFDADNFLYMHRVLPDARFVFMHRRPEEVISSQVRAVRSLLAGRNEYVALVSPRYDRVSRRAAALSIARTLYSDRLPLLVEQVSRNIARVNREFVRHRDRLPPGTATDVTYDELCEAPEASVRRVLADLRLPSPPAADYRALVRPRRPELLAEVTHRLGRIREANGAYCEKAGIDTPCPRALTG